jgi:hypothetical protein
VQFRLAHDPRQAQQEPVVVDTRVVQTFPIADEHPEQRAQLKQLVPVPVVTRQTRRIQTEHQPCLAEANLRDQPLKAMPSGTGCPRLAKIVIDTLDALPRPAKAGGSIGQAILQLRALLVLAHLTGGGLADIDVGALGAMRRADPFVGLIGHAQHGLPPQRDAAAAAGAQAAAPTASGFAMAAPATVADTTAGPPAQTVGESGVEGAGSA